MAQKTVVILSDDIDGSEASQTIRFGIDGLEYEIDLSDKHADELREALKRFTDAGRKMSGGRGGPTTGGKRSSSGIDAKAVRLWAVDNGLKVNTRGRIQSDIMEKYHASH